MTLQEQARALGDPTRHRIFQYLIDAVEAVGVAELTSYFELNHNAIRQHLAKLGDAGLVTEETSPSEGPGRPRLVYRVDPAADGRWGTVGPYQRLSLLLIDMIARGSSARETGRRAGRVTKVPTSDSSDDKVSALGDAVARGGFEPRMRRRDKTVEYILGTCPFADAAAADPDTICGLHLGLAQGLADQLDGVTVTDLVPRDPHRAGCRLSFELAGSESN